MKKRVVEEERGKEKSEAAYCPMRGEECREDCAWYLPGQYGGCAMMLLMYHVRSIRFSLDSSHNRR